MKQGCVRYFLNKPHLRTLFDIFGHSRLSILLSLIVVRNGALCEEFRHLFPTIRLPVSQVGICCCAKWSSGPECSPYGAVKAGIDDPVYNLSAINLNSRIQTCSLQTDALFDSGSAVDSTAVTNLVPTHTADAPYMKDAAIPRPSQIPPAATSCTGCPVSGEV